MIFQAMVRRRRYLLTVVAIAVSILYSLPVFAGSPKSFWSVNRVSSTSTFIVQRTSEATTERKISLFQQLDLTREQHQQIEQIHLHYRQQTLRKKQNIARLQQQLSDMMVGTETVELLRAKHQELNTLRQEMRSLHFESMLATREILTLQQRQKFRELVRDYSEIQ